MTVVKIGILGTRGIPNHYGGYEQAAGFLSAGLVQKGHAVTVYNSHNHPYKADQWNGVEIVRCYDPEYRAGTAGQFIYDLNCIRHARKRDYDVWLLLGYTSSSIWGRLYPKRTLIISNMDGLEWKRSKYTAPVRHFLRYAEKLAVRYSNHLVADSPVIRDHLRERYNADSRYIPYGATIYNNESAALLDKYDVKPGQYHMLMARMEPENNTGMILEGYAASATDKKFIVIGNTGNRYGARLKKQFGGKHNNILFAGPVFDQEDLHSLKNFSHTYFHGHSVGGTNPSLLEAMASKALITAHNNPFNKAILGQDAYYFSSAEDVKNIIDRSADATNEEKMICHNLEKIKNEYSWQAVIDQYEDFILECLDNQ